ncbi:hypothetical protein N9Y42_05180 [Mariniblastus sp.]|nr:hypothetical protein [Mariniblastus sp.]
MAKYAFIGVVVILAAVLISNSGGCGGVSDRVGVVADKALKEIDNLIGSLDIQRKKVERKLDDVREATKKVNEDYIRFQVEYKQAVGEQDKLVASKEKTVSNLKLLQELLGKAEESGSVTYHNREVPKAELESRATDQLEKLKLIKTQTKQSEATVGLLKKNVDILAQQKSASDQNLEKLTAMIKKIDGQIKVLKSQRTAESIVSPDKNINTAFEELETDVKKLDVELEVQMAASNEKLEASLRKLENEMGSTDNDVFFESEDAPSTTLSDIDKALNGE